jgi:hypothetical protein
MHLQIAKIADNGCGFKDARFQKLNCKFTDA